MLINNKIFEDLLKNNKINYDDIKKSSFISIFNNDDFDINMIVPINGRDKFLKPLYKSFKYASDLSNLKICLTVVEISMDHKQKEFCELNQINYININSQIFNKSLAMNFGALFSVNSKSIIFHDLDCLFDRNFFKHIEENIINKKSNVLQCFSDRRVYYLNDELTNLIIDNKLDINDISTSTNGVEVDPTENPQAPGGSIYIDRNIFFEVGGYDPEFFVGYAPEDSFFWDKIELLGENIKSCDNPRIELYHMNHERNIDNSLLTPMIELYKKFHFSNVECKLEILIEKKNILREYYKGNITNKLENFIINEFFKINNLSQNISEDIKKLNKKEIKPEIEQNIYFNINTNLNNLNNCVCGQPINKRDSNFCRRCNRLY